MSGPEEIRSLRTMGILTCRVVLPLVVMWVSVSAHAAATLDLYGTFHAMGVVVTIDAADDPNGTAVSSVAYRIYGRGSPCRLWFKKADTFRVLLLQRSRTPLVASETAIHRACIIEAGLKRPSIAK